MSDEEGRFAIRAVSDGRPVAMATVVAGRYGDFTSTTTRTDAEGRYALVDLAPGPRSLGAGARERGKAHRSLEVAEGASLRWDPVLSEGNIFLGRVVDEEGAPLAGYRPGCGSG